MLTEFSRLHAVSGGHFAAFPGATEQNGAGGFAHNGGIVDQFDFGVKGLFADQQQGIFPRFNPAANIFHG